MSLFNIRNNKKKPCLLLISFSIAFSLIISQISNSTLILSNDIAGINNNSKSIFKSNLSMSDDDSILLQGNEIALNITDFGNLFKTNQEVSVTNQKVVNLSYFLDDVHDWEIYKTQNVVSKIQDTRSWVNDSNFECLNLTIHRVYEIHTNNRTGIPPRYDNDLTKGTSLDQISQPDAIAMRAHFVNYSLEHYYDFLLIDDKDLNIVFRQSGTEMTSFFSPWIPGDILDVYLNTDSGGRDYGYYIDFYEFVNGTIDTNPWGYNDIGYTYYSHGSSLIGGSEGNASSMFIGMYGVPNGDPTNGYYPAYYDGDYAELYQNLTIPRAAVIDAFINFDYFADFAIAANDFVIYCSINGKEIYSKGFYSILQQGKRLWQNTGNINLGLWSNTSNIFESILNQQKLNISIGIKCVVGWIYSNTPDEWQQIFAFDNLTLILTTISNSTQNGIDLTLNKKDLTPGNQWGLSSLNTTEVWNKYPITFTVNTSSPSLTFELNTTLYGIHQTTTKINQQNDEGISFVILDNGTIYWEFYHNFYMPSQYTDFEFIIEKPLNWIFLSVFDPTLQQRSFEDGGIGDINLKVNTSEAIFPGWWSFKATSPNYYNNTNIKILKSGNWLESALFESGESTQIKSIVQYDNETPANINYTLTNLKIYDPDGNMWYNNSLAPELTGEVIFSMPKFTSENTLGGEYTYTLIWSNGTALGGISSSFIIIHESKLELEKPEEAEEDLIIEGFLGDIIPLRVYLFDDENDLPISGASVYYEGHDGDNEYLEESSPGIYETTIDTDDYKSAGSYDIEIITSKIGFSSSDLEIKLVLAEESNLFFWIIIAILLSVVSVLSVLSVRSYVILPRKRRKELELIAKTQRFKDLQNIQAVVVIEKTGGIPVYMKSYSILETQNKDLFSGFIQAIITIGDEIAGKKAIIIEEAKPDKIDKLVELDFKHFNCLIADKDPIRLVFILKESASERLKNLVIELLCNIYSDHSTLFRSWDGSLDKFEILIPPILNKYFELFYKEEFKLTGPAQLVAIRKENELNVMELRILNVIRSFAKNKSEFYLETILQLVAEKNKDVIIEGIENLINRKVIIPENP